MGTDLIQDVNNDWKMIAFEIKPIGFMGNSSESDFSFLASSILSFAIHEGEDWFSSFR